MWELSFATGSVSYQGTTFIVPLDRINSAWNDRRIVPLLQFLPAVFKAPSSPENPKALVSLISGAYYARARKQLIVEADKPIHFAVEGNQ